MPQPGKAVLNLPHSRRAMCALEVNGKMVPQVWAPYCWEVECAAGKNTFVLEISNTPFDALNAPEHRQYMRDNKFENAYMGHCDKFEKIFPDEKPLSEAYLEW